MGPIRHRRDAGGAPRSGTSSFARIAIPVFRKRAEYRALGLANNRPFGALCLKTGRLGVSLKTAGNPVDCDTRASPECSRSACFSSGLRSWQTFKAPCEFKWARLNSLIHFVSPPPRSRAAALGSLHAPFPISMSSKRHRSSLASLRGLGCA